MKMVPFLDVTISLQFVRFTENSTFQQTRQKRRRNVVEESLILFRSSATPEHVSQLNRKSSKPYHSLSALLKSGLTCNLKIPLVIFLKLLIIIF